MDPDPGFLLNIQPDLYLISIDVEEIYDIFKVPEKTTLFVPSTLISGP
jgi:hypothetical protein